jgi:hypothetical protein
VQIENRKGLGARRIHRRGGIKSIVSPIVGKRRKKDGQRGKPDCDDPEPHFALYDGLNAAGATVALDNQFTS